MKLLNFIEERKNHIFTDRKDVELWEAFLSAAKFPSPERVFFISKVKILFDKKWIYYFFLSKEITRQKLMRLLLVKELSLWGKFDFSIPIYFQPDGVNLSYLKTRLFDLSLGQICVWGKHIPKNCENFKM